MAQQPFIKKAIKALLMMPVLLMLNGCIYLVVGGVGAVGGYIVSPDTVEGITENDKNSVYDASIEISSIMGSVVEQNVDGGVILAKINTADVTISMVPISETTVKLMVKARKLYLPRINLAQDIYVKIMNYLNE